MKNTPSSHETSGTKEELYDREKQLAMQETRLREYQERVLRYERLAEDATRVALQEKELRLNKLAEELKQREIQARNKLATAVESLELLKSQPPMQAASPWPPSMPRNPKMNLEHRDQSSVSDAITTDDDEDELPASEVSAPTSRKSAKFILPEVEDKSPEIEDVQEDISVDVTVHEEKPDEDTAGATGTNVCKKHEKSNIRPVLFLQDSSGTCPEVSPGIEGQARPDLSPTFGYSGYLVFPRHLNYFCIAV